MNVFTKYFGLALLSAGLHGQLTAQATLVADFQFDNNINDQLGNASSSIFNNATTSFAGGAMSWQADSVNPGGGGGLAVRVPDALFSEGNYSIAIEFQLSEVSGYRKVIDFKRRGSDLGLYVNSELRIFSVGGYGPTTWRPDSTYSVLMTRDAVKDSVYAYIYNNGQLYRESVGEDGFGDYVAELDGLDRVLGFFYDDSTTVSEYARGGSVSRIRIWNGIVDQGGITGRTEASTQAGFTLSPNPAQSQLNLRFPAAQSGVVEILDASGRLVRSSAVQKSFDLTLPVADLPAGLYIVRVGDKAARFVKE